MTNSPITVSNGLFTATLDFGTGIFDGTAYWLEVAVRTNGGSSFTTLMQRQELTPDPYAIYAEGANAAGLSGTIPMASLSGTYGSAVTFSNASNSFAGDGSGLTGLNASELSSGIVPDARLDAAVARTNQVWLLNGNSGTSPLTNFLGTTDTQPLELRVDNQRALRLEPRPSSPNVIAGYSGNSAGPGQGVVIGGGGSAAGVNSAVGNFPVIAGGFGNLAADEAAVSGGARNQAAAPFAVIAGGSDNNAGDHAAVSGGSSNVALGPYSVVAGGNLNMTILPLSTVSGGSYNIAEGYASVIGGGGGEDALLTGLTNHAGGNWSVIGGGRANEALGESSTVGGGDNNHARAIQATASGGVGNFADGEYATVGGGYYNTADHHAATVSGGEENGAINMDATVGGGVGNYASGTNSTIGGGGNNIAEGIFSTVPGGERADPTQYGQLAHASGMFMNPGDAQHSVFVMRTLTDILNPLKNLALDGGGTLLRIERNHTLTFHILLVARAEPPLTDSAGYEFNGVVKSSGGTAVFVGPPLAMTLGQDVASWSATLNLIGSDMTISVDGGGGSGYPGAVRWVARVDAAEVAW